MRIFESAVIVVVAVAFAVKASARIHSIRFDSTAELD